MRYLLAILMCMLLLPAEFVHAGTVTRTSSFAYDANTGLLIQEVIEPDNSALRLQTDYTYDAYGNKLSVTVSGSDIVRRTTNNTYDSRGQFPLTTTNALNQSETGSYDTRFGKAVTLTGPNGLTTNWAYDGFGRKVQETRADGTQTNVAYNTCDGTCPYNAKYYVVTTTAGAPTSYVYYDMLNRKLREQTQGFNGQLTTVDIEYDSDGRVSRTSRPYYMGDTVYWSTIEYDQLNRVLQATAPDGSTNSTTYNGLSTTSTNVLGQTETRIKNSQGQLIQVIDTLSNSISYQYDPFGNLTQTTDAKGNITTLSYDVRGRKIAMTDLDMGYWTYQYDVLSELVKQTDAKNQSVTMTYDKLGRMLSRTEPDLISNWTYDTAANGIGKLATVTSDNGFSRTYSYDAYGRPWRESSVIDTTYNVDKAYDSYGRVSTITYPTGFAVNNIYNTYGYLSEVRNAANNALYWQGNQKDAEGHVLYETLGNGLVNTRTYDPLTGRVSVIAAGVGGVGNVQYQAFTFDAIGNLTTRSDNVTNSSEMFYYDGLNRLTSATQGANPTLTYTYDSIGNISSKSDAGAYLYGARPHAVNQVSGTLNATYAYDANGNLLSGAGRTVTYTSWNMPIQITGSGGTVSFNYDADHVRIKEVSPDGTTIELSPRIDAGIHFEKITDTSGVIEYLHYIYGGSGVVGIYTSRSNGVNDTRYFHKDHLDSIAVVSNDTGAVMARYGFDPFGKRSVLSGDGTATHHGFTGHEELTEVGLVHMNGRVYDPILGRFMSADPNIQAPGNGQSFNRYSYTMNNPLSYTDPSGFSWWTDFRDSILKPAIAIAASYFLGPGGYSALGVTGNAATSAIVAGAASGAIMTGTVDGALQGGLTAGLFYGAGSLVPGDAGSLSKVLGHAVAGCISSAAGGGSCGSGAAAAGFAEFAGPHIRDLPGYGNVVKYAVLGGTASVLGGGKFQNGAVTGAYGYLFNCVAHECWKQGALGTAKAVGGGLTALTGVTICGATEGVGCIVGGPMAAFGASDAWQGGSMTIDAVNGITSEGFNLIKTGFQEAMPQWGGAVYEGASLTLNVGALTAKVPLIVGASDGIDRVKTMFDVTVSRWDNARSFGSMVVSQSVNRALLAGSALMKAFGFGKEVNAAGLQ